VADWRRARREAARRRRRQRRRAGAVLLLAMLVGVAVWLGARGDRRAGAGAPEAYVVPVTQPAPAPAAPSLRRARLGPSLPSRPPARSLDVPVLMFHRVAGRETATNAVSRDLTVAPSRFDAELEWLARHGFHPVHLETLFGALEYGRPLPAEPVVLTFDDGYVDDAMTVAALLLRRGWPGAFFVITGRVGERAFLTWRQIEQLDREGMDIGSHTVDHVDLPGLSALDLRHELVDSRRQLERRLGHPVYWFAYPAGAWDAASAVEVRRAGYLLAFTTATGPDLSGDALLSEPRVRIRGDESLATFAGELAAAERCRRLLCGA
jgi:peptidoglycan/xylan/chitin deacetylase (PgdA/CDA1 family)